MKEGNKEKWSRIWIGTIIAALLAAIGLFAVMLQMEKKVLSDYEKKNIYVAVREIPKGLRLDGENYEEYMTLKELDKTCVPETALQDPAQLYGLTAKETIEEGVLLTKGMFEEFNHVTADMKQPVIAGFKAEDLYQVAGGVLRAGDRIHIYTVAEDGQAGLVWESVYVEQVFDSAGTAIVPGNTTSAAQRMNVFLDAEDVEKFYSELARGTLRVVKVCDG